MIPSESQTEDTLAVNRVHAQTDEQIAQAKTEAADLVVQEKDRADVAVNQISKIEAQAEELVASIRAQCEAQISQAKSQANEIAAKETARADEALDQATQIKAQADEKLSAQGAQIAQIKADAAEIKDITAQCEELIAHAHAEAQRAIAAEKARADEIAEQLAKIQSEIEDRLSEAQSQAQENEERYNQMVVDITQELSDKEKEIANLRKESRWTSVMIVLCVLVVVIEVAYIVFFG